MMELDKEELQEQRVQASKHKEYVVQNHSDVSGKVVLGNNLLSYFLFFYCSRKIIFFPEVIINFYREGCIINFYREGCIQTSAGYVLSVILDEFIMSIERKEENALRDLQKLKESQKVNEEKQQ